jgi:hypothetical protein
MLISLPQGPILLRLRERRVGACLRLPAAAGAPSITRSVEKREHRPQGVATSLSPAFLGS